MSLIVSGEIAYGKSSAAVFVSDTELQNGKKFSVSKDSKIRTSSSPWAPWGESNDLPLKMAKDIEDCGVLNAALDAKARIAIGKGPQPFLLANVDNDGKEELEFVKDSEIHDWLEMNGSYDFSLNSTYDLFGYGWSATQLLLSRNRKKINRIKRTDVVEARLKLRDKKTGLSDTLFLNADWGYSSSAEDIKSIPILEEGNEANDLLERTEYEYAVINRCLRNGRQYYPLPLWWSTKKWVDIAKSLPAMKAAMFKNQMTIKYVVTISSSYWTRMYPTWNNPQDFTAEKRLEVMTQKWTEIDKYLAGNENQYKSIFANNYIDPVTQKEVSDIKVDVLDDKMKDGKLLPDSAAANSEILFALQINPALFGAGQPQGAYSNNAGGSNIRESYMAQIMLLEWERRQNARIFNVIKNYNGWSQRLEKNEKRLVFRYPSNLLTTLDTGKSTKPELV